MAHDDAMEPSLTRFSSALTSGASGTSGTLGTSATSGNGTATSTVSAPAASLSTASLSTASPSDAVEFCPTTPLPTGPVLRPALPNAPLFATASAFSYSQCICERFVDMDAALITRHVMGSQNALRSIVAAINASTLVQWSGSAAQLCASKLDSMRQLVTVIDDELANTARMTTIRGQGR